MLVNDKVNVIGFIVGVDTVVHWAYKVKPAVSPCVYGNEIADPPELARNHPLNVFPLFVGFPGFETVPPVVVEPFEITLPP